MAKILLVGENPQSGTGNGNMMAGILSQLRNGKHSLFIFAQGDPVIESVIQDSMPDVVSIPAHDPMDPWGQNKLLKTIELLKPDLVFFVGIDIWRYSDIYPHLFPMSKKMGFQTMALAPYDLPSVRSDWLSWFSAFDRVLIYSKFGHDLVSPYLKNATYFRPLLANMEKFRESPAARCAGRNTMLANLTEDDILVGFVGHNQFRKNIMALIEGSDSEPVP